MSATSSGSHAPLSRRPDPRLNSASRLVLPGSRRVLLRVQTGFLEVRDLLRAVGGFGAAF